MKHIYRLLIAAALLTTSSCLDDRSNTDFTPLANVTIEGMDEQYGIDLFDTLRINPEITTDLGDKADLSYAWYVYSNETYYFADTISYEKNLRAQIRNQVPGIGYFLTLKVTDNKTGVFYKKTSKFSVSTSLTSGTMMLCKTGTKNEVHFIRSSNGALIEDVYTNANTGEAIPGEPTKIFFVNPNSSKPAIMKRVYIMSDDITGGAIVDPVTFKRESWLRDYFLIPPTLTAHPTLRTTAYAKGILPDYLIINGKVFNRAANMAEPKWKSELIRVKAPTSYDMAPFFICNAGANPVFFDNLNGRFLNHSVNNKGELLSYTGSTVTAFDHANLPMKLIHAGFSTKPAQFYGLFRDNATSKLYILKFTPGNVADFKAEAKIELTATNAPHIGEATCYMTDQNYKGILLYAVGGKVYSLDVDNLSASLGETTMIDLSAENMTVDCMNFYQYIKDGVTIKTVRMGVRNGSYAGAKKGGIIFTEAISVGGLRLIEKSRTMGFCDRIIDINEKLN